MSTTLLKTPAMLASEQARSQAKARTHDLQTKDKIDRIRQALDASQKAKDYYELAINLNVSGGLAHLPIEARDRMDVYIKILKADLFDLGVSAEDIQPAATE